jgi:hypothetical protein
VWCGVSFIARACGSDSGILQYNHHPPPFISAQYNHIKVIDAGLRSTPTSRASSLQDLTPCKRHTRKVDGPTEVTTSSSCSRLPRMIWVLAFEMEVMDGMGGQR